MKTSVILALIGVCAGSIRYTPEVEAERARFFEAFRAAQRDAAPTLYIAEPPRWTGPVAATVPAGVDGTIVPVSDTADVDAARQAFFNAYSAQLAATGASVPAVPVAAAAVVAAPALAPAPVVPAQPRWAGPFAASVPAGLPGSPKVVPYTAEVLEARNAFQKAYQNQLAAVDD